MWPLSLLNHLGFPLTYAFFFRTKWSMIYMKCFSIQHMTCFPMLSLSLPMTWLHLSYPIYIIWIFVCHASLSGSNVLLWWDFFYAHAFFPGINMLVHEWNDFPIWHDYLFLLCTCFFSRNKYATWVKWLSYMTWLSLSSMHMLFSRNKYAT